MGITPEKSENDHAAKHIFNTWPQELTFWSDNSCSRTLIHIWSCLPTMVTSFSDVKGSVYMRKTTYTRALYIHHFIRLWIGVGWERPKFISLENPFLLHAECNNLVAVHLIILVRQPLKFGDPSWSQENSQLCYLLEMVVDGSLHWLP